MGIKSASSEGGSESQIQSTQGWGAGQGGEKRRPVNISFLSYFFFFFFVETSFLSSWVLVPVVGTGSSLSLRSGHNLKKSLTEHMTGVAGPPLSLFSPWGSLGRTRPSLWHRLGEGGPTYRQSLQQSWFALL